MDNLLIYIQTEEEPLKQKELVFEKIWEAGIKLKCLNVSFFSKVKLNI